LSRGVDGERSEDWELRRVERAKCVLRQLQAVLTYTYERVHVAEQARRLSMSRDRVRWMQRVLGLRSGRIKSGWLSTAVGASSRGMEAA
jgi:hypothetical protein